MHASTRWKDWASTPVHAGTRWRVRWVFRHRSQPSPRYQLRGDGSAAIATPGLQRTYRRWCTSHIVAVLALLLLCSQPSPATTKGPWGCNSRTPAAAHARRQLQPLSGSNSGLHPHRSPARSPVHLCKGRRHMFLPPVHHCTRRWERFPSPMLHSTGGRDSFPPVCTATLCGWTGSPPLSP